MAAERVLASLAGRILDLERYTEVTESETHDFIEAQKNRNTWRKTEGDVKLFTDWLLEGKNERRKLEVIPESELDKYLAMFILSIKKSNGQDYEPDSLVSKYNSVGRYLREKRKVNINRETAFNHSRDVLSKKCKQLKDAGKGTRSKKAEAFTPEEIAQLKDSKELSLGVYGYLYVITLLQKYASNL